MKTRVAAFVFGVGTGAVIVFAILLLCMTSGTEFKTYLMKYGDHDGNGVVATSKFVVVFEGMKDIGAGASHVTLQGKDGIIPAFWRGYSESWGAIGNQITDMNLYQPAFGRAILFFNKQTIMVEEEATILRVGSDTFALDEQLVVVVDEEGVPRQVSQAEAIKFVSSLPEWFTDDSVSARPPAGI